MTNESKDAAQLEFERDEREQALEELMPELMPEIDRFRRKIIRLSEDWIDDTLSYEHILEAVCDALQND